MFTVERLTIAETFSALVCRSTFSLHMQAPVLTTRSWRVTSSRLVHSSRRRQQRRCSAAQGESSLRLVGQNGMHSIAPDQEILIGPGPECDVQLRSASGRRPLRASVSFRKGRAYVKAVPDQLLDDDDFDIVALATGIFVDDRELRPGVDYLVSPGAKLRFGEAADEHEALQVEFDEPETSNPAGLDMMMKAMARTPEVREKLA